MPQLETPVHSALICQICSINNELYYKTIHLKVCKKCLFLLDYAVTVLIQVDPYNTSLNRACDKALDIAIHPISSGHRNLHLQWNLSHRTFMYYFLLFSLSSFLQCIAKFGNIPTRFSSSFVREFIMNKRFLSRSVGQ